MSYYVKETKFRSRLKKNVASKFRTLVHSRVRIC